MGPVVSRPTGNLVRVLARAYKRAMRAGAPVVGADLLLYYTAMPGAFPRMEAPFFWEWDYRAVRRGGQGAEDPPPPAPLVPVPGLDAEVEFETDMLVRLAIHTAVLENSGRRARSGPEFSPAARHAVYEAIHEASRDGRPTVNPRHLLVAVLSLGAGPAADLARTWAVEDYRMLPALIRADPRFRDDGAPAYPAVQFLQLFRIVPGGTGGTDVDEPFRRIMDFVVSRMRNRQRRQYERWGACYGHPLLTDVESEARIHAARLGRGHVTSADVLLAILDADEQWQAAGITLPAPLDRYNEGGAILRRHGVRFREALWAAIDLPAPGEDDLTGVPSRGWPKNRLTRSAPFGRTALVALRSASHAARQAHRPFAGTTQVLIAALGDAYGPAAYLLIRLGVDPAAVRAEAVARLEQAGVSR